MDDDIEAIINGRERTIKRNQKLYKRERSNLYKDGRLGWHVDPEDIKQRRCLVCREDFKSFGAGHRICSKCARRKDVQEMAELCKKVMKAKIT